MVVAGFRRVGRVVLGALGPADVVVSWRGVWCRWGSPGEYKLASVVVGGREGVYGARFRRGFFFFLYWFRGGRLRRFSGDRDGGFFPGATPGFAHVFAFVVAARMRILYSVSWRGP